MRLAPTRTRQIAACSAMALTFCVVCQAVAAPAGWTQIWNDEFDGSTLDTTKWAPEFTTAPYNNEQQAYLPQQVTVAGGNLVITSENLPYQGKPYRSGRVHSKWTHQYGRWEVRADLPTSQGMWPAIWLLPDATQYAWPSQGEIDIMENKGHQPNLTSAAYHYGTTDHYQTAEQTAARFGQSVNYHDSFHVYAVEWDKTKVRFFVDDVNWMTVYDADVGGFISHQTAPMQTTLNTAVGGSFLGNNFQPNSSTVWPQQFLIDYVRVFDRNTTPLHFRNGSFDQRDGSLAGWSVFGNKVNTNNVSISSESVNDGLASVKLFGQFTSNTNFSGVSQGITVKAGDQINAAAKSFIRSQDSILGTANSLQMKIEFYNDFGGKYGSASFLSEVTSTIATGTTTNDVWRDHSLAAVAPAGAVEARLSFVFTQTAANGGGAIHIDNVSFKDLNVLDVADANGDGQVDGADFLVWQRHLNAADASGPADGDFNFDGAVDKRDLDVWNQQSGNAAAPNGQPAAAAAPEPSTAMLTLTTLAGVLGRLRTSASCHDVPLESFR
jgi:beta-glucanase (GH16 family)